jgi:ferric-dicitrate binding protein FerR (iron transport regulator)
MILVDGSEFNMAHNSDMTLKSIGAHGAGGGIFRLLKGMMQGAVHKLADGEHLIIETPSGVAAVKGTQYQVEASDEKTELKVLSGRVDLSDPAGKGDLIVGPGQAAMSYPDRVGALRTMNRDEVESLKASFAVKVRQAQSDYLKRVKAIRNEP